MPQAVVIANPFAGTARGRVTGEQACALLSERGLQAEFRPTESRHHATALARQAAAQGAGLVIALGGDGTVHEVAAGLVGTETPMGVLPSGSGNDFARAVGCFNLDDALETVARGHDQRMDTGLVNDEFFVNSLGLLASGLISVRSAKLWRWLGHRRYVLASAGTLLSYFGQKVTWSLEGADGGKQTLQGRYLMAEICNSPFTGGGFSFAPEADLSSGCLEACLIKGIAPWTAMQQLPKAAKGGRLNHPSISVSPFRRLEFTVDRPVGYHRDGEADFLPAGTHVVQVNPGSIKVRVPAQWPSRESI